MHHSFWLPAIHQFSLIDRVQSCSDHIQRQASRQIEPDSTFDWEKLKGDLIQIMTKKACDLVITEPTEPDPDNVTNEEADKIVKLTN